MCSASFNRPVVVLRFSGEEFRGVHGRVREGTLKCRPRYVSASTHEAPRRRQLGSYQSPSTALVRSVRLPAWGTSSVPPSFRAKTVKAALKTRYAVATAAVVR